MPAWVDEAGRHAARWLVSGLPAFRQLAERETHLRSAGTGSW